MKVVFFEYFLLLFFLSQFSCSLGVGLSRELVFNSYQLKCVGGTAEDFKGEFQPTEVHCYHEPEGWKCEADMQPFITFGSSIVKCPEGFIITEANVDKHDCTLEYTLDFVQFDYDPIEEGTYTGSFLTIVFGLVLFYFFRRMPNNQYNNININRVAGAADATGPPNPKVLRMIAYTIFVVVAIASLLFLFTCAYILTAFNLE